MTEPLGLVEELDETLLLRVTQAELEELAATEDLDIITGRVESLSASLSMAKAASAFRG